MIKLTDILNEAASTKEYWANIVQNKRKYPQYQVLSNEQDAELRDELMSPTTSPQRKEEIRKTFIESMLATAFWVALAQSKMGKVSFEEAFGNAQKGIVEAFRTMDWERPVLFKTHATKRALAQARNAFYNFASTVKIPMDIQQQYNAAVGGEEDKPALFRKVALDAPTKQKADKYDEFGDTQITSYSAMDIPDQSDEATDTELKIRKYFDRLRSQVNTPGQINQINQAQTFLYHLVGFGDYDQLDPVEIANEFNVTPETVHNRLRKFAPFYRDI